MKHYKDVAEEALRRRDEYDVQRNQRKQMLRRSLRLLPAGAAEPRKPTAPMRPT